MGRVEGKVILVTGGAGGIGRAIVERLAAEGARTVVADLDLGRAQAVADAASGLALALDVSDEQRWIEVLAEVEHRCGRLDALVNNAGINHSHDGESPEDFSVGDLRRLFAVNLEGVALGCKHALPVLARGGGAIVNMSSVAALLPCDFIAAYGASKAAVAHWTKSVALHAAHRGYKVRCNSVHPGSVLTPMMDELFARMSQRGGISAGEAEAGLRKLIPMGCHQEPLDIANAVLFLCSDESRYITGLELVVDGGMTLAL